MGIVIAERKNEWQFAVSQSHQIPLEVPRIGEASHSYQSMEPKLLSKSRRSGYFAFICAFVTLLSSEESLVSSFTSPWSSNSLITNHCANNKPTLTAVNRVGLKVYHRVRDSSGMLHGGTSISMVYDVLQNSENLIAISTQLFDSAIRHNMPEVLASYIVPSAGAVELDSILGASETIIATTTRDILPGFLEISTLSSFDTAAAAIDFNAIFTKAVSTGKAGTVHHLCPN